MFSVTLAPLSYLSAKLRRLLSSIPPPGTAQLATLMLLGASLGHAIAQSQLQNQTLPARLARAIAASRALGPASRAQRVHFSIGLPLRHQPELDALLAELADPASPRYRHFLTPAQFATQFGPSVEEYTTLMRFAIEHHLTITQTHGNRMLLSLSALVPDVEAAFALHLNTYSHPTRGRFFAPDREPTLPGTVTTLDVSGLDNFVVPTPMDLHHSPLASSARPSVSGSGPAGYFIGSDFRTAYAPGVTLTGASQTVGLIEFDGFFAGDVTANFAQAKLPVIPVSTVMLNGMNGSAGGDNIEVILDIMMAAYMAPAAKVIVYEGQVPNDILNRMATDNLASQLSSSWTFGGVNATTEQIFKQYAAQGQTLFQASGDSGGYTAGVAPPADDPALTVVGGTSLATQGAGGAWQSESAWAGSGGGVSTRYAIPSWQVGQNMSARGGSLTMRNIPDVALTADVQMFLICNNGQRISVGGTSAAAPLWAGFLALVNQHAVTNKKPLVGFLNPALYALGNSTSYASTLHDITAGTNGAFKTVPGYDLATGWGSPFGQPLIDALTGTSAAPAFSLASASSSLTIKPAGTVSTVITVANQNGFAGPVALTLTGLPSGITGTFSPASTSTSSTLALTAAAGVSLGSFPVKITGTYGSLTSSASLTVTVASPTFSVTASSIAISLSRPASASTVVTIAPINGFSGPVALAAVGLPAGVTAAFSPATLASGPSTLTLAAAATAPASVSPITISGTSGTLKVSTTLVLTVQVPSFNLGFTPASLILPRGSSASGSVSMTPVNGFSGAVAYKASGLPVGVTAAFSPTTAAAGAQTLTLTAAPSAPASTSIVTITGTSGSITSSTTFPLSVQVPGFALAFSPASLIVPRGSAASGAVAVTPINGFTGSLTFTAAGLPSGVTAAFSPSATTTGNRSLTVTVSSSAAAAVSTVTVTGTSGTVTASTTFSLTVPSPSFILAVTPGSLGVPRGSSASAITSVVPVAGFNAAVALTAGGLPTGVTMIPGTASASGIPVTFASASTVTAGSYPVTLTGTSGALTSTAKLTINVIVPQVGTSFVNLAPGYNINGFNTEGLPFNGTGLDGGLNGSFTAYSANLIGLQQIVAGTSFYFGPANTLNSVSGGTVALPAGQFTSLKLLATAVNGNKTAQTFKITYTDGSSTIINQSLSDWFSPASFSGELKALTMARRVTGLGAIDNRTFYLYEYSINLNPAKTVASLTLPANRNVVILAATLASATAAVR